MKVNRSLKYQHHLQQLIFYSLLLIVVASVAVVSHRYYFTADWTANHRHSLSPTTMELLAMLDSPVTIEVFISPGHSYQQAVESLLRRYQQQSTQLQIHYIDPVTQPQRVRELAIQQQAEIVVSGQQGQQHVLDLSEQSLSNAIINVSRHSLPTLIFITGHGERDIFGDNHFDMAQWRHQLSVTGFEVQSLSVHDAAQHSNAEDNVVWIIASSQQQWPAADIAVLQSHLQQGGNLLWLSEPETDIGLISISEQLNLNFVPGTIIDPNAGKLGLEDPRFVIVTDYANHPVTTAMSSVALLPIAHAIQLVDTTTDWQAIELMQSQSDSWSALGPLASQQPESILFDEALDIPGPLTLGVLLERSISENHQQRAAVFGDGDFVSNLYLGNAANLELAMALTNWLAADDKAIQIPLIKTADSQLLLSEFQALLIGFGFLLLLPLTILLIGIGCWWNRKRR